jgi:hypothetical protein
MRDTPYGTPFFNRFANDKIDGPNLDHEKIQGLAIVLEETERGESKFAGSYLFEVLND